ncbi:MAG: carbonic anhydrase family protein, partial [Xanthobacteraceae bacterium]
TPPCSETVTWIVYNQPISVAEADIAAFKAIFPMDARPLQRLNRRYLLIGR